MSFAATRQPILAKPFAWSYSRLKNYETCPRRHAEIDLLKHYDDSGPAMMMGSKAHEALAARLGKGTPLPENFIHYEETVAGVLDITTKLRELTSKPPKLAVEQQLAINQSYRPTSWFGHDAWFRVILDVAITAPPHAAIVDWKTGQRPVEEPLQLALNAAVVMLYHPDINTVHTSYKYIELQPIWTDRVPFVRSALPEIWNGVLPRVRAMQKAYETNDYPPKHGKLCSRSCPVSTCEFHGKRYVDA